MSKVSKQENFRRRKRRIRSQVIGSAACPRFSVSKSNQHFFVQLIDDAAGVTLCSQSDAPFSKMKTRTEKATAVGKAIAEVAVKKGITTVVFDRSGYTYHGHVKAIADGAREGGLEF